MTDNITHIDDMTQAESKDTKSPSAERVAAARKKLGDAVDGVSKKAKGASDRVRDGAREKYGAAGDSLRHGYDRVTKDLEHLGEDVNEYVRHNPGKSVAIAAGIGFLVGILLRGRRD